MTLNARQRRFVQEYLVDLNGAAAYRRAGYTANSDKAAGANASRLIADDRVASAIRAAQERAAMKAELTNEWILERLMREAGLEADDASSASRVAALKVLSQIKGLLQLKVKFDGLPAVRVVGGVDVGLLTGATAQEAQPRPALPAAGTNGHVNGEANGGG